MVLFIEKYKLDLLQTIKAEGFRKRLIVKQLL
jgi:hypothetical protein